MSKPRQPRHPSERARLAEALGLVLIALLILAITLARFGRSIPWHAR